jgi:tetratricopeptide (TPR) repeat protein
VALRFARRPAEALEVLDRAIELGAPAAQVQLQRAWALCSLGRYQAALRAHDVAKESLPASAAPVLALIRANACYGLRRYEETLAALEQAPATGGAATQVKVLRVRSLTALRRFDEAKSESDFCLLIYPDEPFYHVLHSEVLEAAEGSPAALAEFAGARKRFPENHEIIRRHAQLLLNAGRPEEEKEKRGER